MRADLETILCKFGHDGAIFVVAEVICAKKFTDGHIDGQTTDAARFDNNNNNNNNNNNTIYRAPFTKRPGALTQLAVILDIIQFLGDA